MRAMSPLAAAALRCVSLIVLASAMPSAMADWRADPSDRQQVAAEQAIAAIREKRSDSGRFFDEAYGFLIFPKVTRIGFGFGGAYGRGLVVEGDEVIGSTSFRQFTSGIQAGARSFSMILLFKDRQALEYYKVGERQFLGQAGLALATYGVAGTPAFNDGVAIFTVTRLGLMAEFTVSGARFTFEPNAATEAAE
jgi:lipid-binding SYLF domain-containing protein